MKRYSYILAIIFIALQHLTVLAETIPQKQAAQIAQSFFNETNHRVMPGVKLAYNGRRLTTDRLFVPFYVYNQPQGGFVIISAENKTFPILGYSLKENFDPDKMGDKTKALLASYARDIEMIRYDSEIPAEAIKAWQNIPEYIESILTATYDATDPTMDMTEAEQRINYLIESGKAEETASDIFTPSQWSEMINDELATHKSIAIGLISNPGKVSTGIVYGKKGDYYRIELDQRNQWLMRLHASEIMSGAQLADFSSNVAVALPHKEEIPFEYLDSYALSDLVKPESVATRISVTPEEPEIESIGGGHYAVKLPENVKMVTIYNLGGAITGIRTFRQTDTAHIDLSIEPSGFYFALLIGESGKPYGIKLTR